MRSHTIVTAALTLLATPSAAFAQGLPPLTAPLDSGRLVRLRLDDQRVMRGRLLRPLTAESVQVTFCRYPAPPCRHPDASGVMTIAAERIVTLDVRRGTRLWRGVAIGATIGAVLGGVGGWLYNGLCDRAGCGGPVAGWVFAGAVQFGLWGALFGSQSVVWGPP